VSGPGKRKYPSGVQRGNEVRGRAGLIKSQASLRPSTVQPPSRGISIATKDGEGKEEGKSVVPGSSTESIPGGAGPTRHQQKEKKRSGRPRWLQTEKVKNTVDADV